VVGWLDVKCGGKFEIVFSIFDIVVNDTMNEESTHIFRSLAFIGDADKPSLRIDVGENDSIFSTWKFIWW